MKGRVALAVVVVAASCGPPCRGISVTQVPVTCTTDATFRGELHFDDAATFESFLETDCMPGFDQTQIDALVASVDFTTNAVFVASGNRAQGLRCISERTNDTVDVCADGLRVGFADVVTDEVDCVGKWTVGFALPRSEMRAALGQSVVAQ